MPPGNKIVLVLVVALDPLREKKIENDEQDDDDCFVQLETAMNYFPLPAFPNPGFSKTPLRLRVATAY